MGSPVERHVTYAEHPSAEGTTALQARIFHPEDAAGPVPLLVWLHSGGFRSGWIGARPHIRIARQWSSQGYAVAFMQYRLRARPEDLRPATRQLLPRLADDAARNAPEINPAFTGARAIAAVEDAAACLGWLAENAAAQGFDGRFLLGGSSAGAMTVLNLLSLAPHLGFDLPDIATAFAMSGAFAYPSFFTPHKTRILALHGSYESRISVPSIRAYVARDENCTLLEDTGHAHGDLRLNRHEHLRSAVRRMVEFDRGAAPAPARTATDRPAVKDSHRICVFTCVKNEGPFLLEWIAHNRAIGVTDFIVFSNDCTDGTHELLERLDAMGIVNHIPNPSMRLKSPQHLALAIANAPFHKALRRADYAILTDVDEFIQVNVGDGTLNALIAAAGYPDVLSLSELVYGFGGVETFRDRPVTEQFQFAQTPNPDRENARRGVKSIMRVSPGIAVYSNHRPTLARDAAEGIRWVDGAGLPVTRDFIAKGERGCDARGRYRLGRVNHYTLRSGESMLVKFQRGDAVRAARMRKRYIRQRNGRDIRDTGIDRHLPALHAELARLMQDADLARLHAQCVARHRQMIAALKSDPAYADIWKAIRNQSNLGCLAELRKPAAE